MKPYDVYLFRVAAVIVIPLIFLGCAHGVLNSAYLLPEPTGSPLKNISPKTFAFKEFSDAREDADPLFVFGDNKPRNDVKWKMGPLEQPPATIVATAIKREFEMNGHTCVADTPSSDFIIEGSLQKYKVVGTGSSYFQQKFRTEVAVKLTVTSVSDTKRVFTKNYEGEYAGVIGAVGSGGLGNLIPLLKAALFEMVKEISTDPELIAFIEK